MTYYKPAEAGDTVYRPVTDHPNFPKQFRVGDPYMFTEREVAERIAEAWNSYGGEWKWYVKEFVLLPKEEPEPEPEGEQLSFW